MDNKVDFFNGITSALLVAIVSYLPFKEAVRTSILSKQWRHIWRETATLEFQESYFVNHNASEESQNSQRANFIQFIGNLLQNYPRKGILMFTLFCSKPDEFLTQLRNFVGFAVSHNARELELDFSDPNWDVYDEEERNAVIDLPRQENQTSAIESLKLFMCNIDAASFTNFRVLKNVSFGWIEFKMASVKALLVNCPLLESLALKKCWGLECLEICLPDSRLKKLVIDKCKFVQDYVNIEGPKLTFLKYSGKIGQFFMYGQRDLVEVDLDFGMEPGFAEIGNLLYNFAQEVFAAQILTVCGVFLQMVPQGEEPFSLENELNVRHLILKTAMHHNEYIGIKFMLNSCPKLQVLTIEITDNAKIFDEYDAPYTINIDEFWVKNLIVEKCVKSSVEVVNIKGFKGNRSELEILKYIMTFGQRLREVNLYVPEVGDRAQFLANADVVKSYRTHYPNIVTVF